MDTWVGVPADRVVAVIAQLPDGRSQWASGFLVARDRVLTAWHCTVDRQSKEPAVSLSVVRESDGRSAEVDLSRIVSCHSLSPEDDLDVAVLALAGPPWDDDVKPPGSRESTGASAQNWSIAKRWDTRTSSVTRRPGCAIPWSCTDRSVGWRTGTPAI